MVKTNSMFIELGSSLPDAEMLNVNLKEYGKFDFSHLDERHLFNHPDISFGWGYAKIKISTHAIKGLAESDFVLAAKIEVKTQLE